MSTVAHRAAREHRTIRLPLTEADYERFLNEGELARAPLDRLYGQHPELFPEGWRQGYVFYGFTEPSRQQHRRCRRVRLRASDEVFSVAPAFVMPYMTAPVAEVEKALFLMRFHVPCGALVYVFGRDARYEYRLQQGLGRFGVVGTTVKVPERLPQDLVADEKHSRLQGEKITIATTAGEGCILGASVSDSASEAALTHAYGVFAEEAQAAGDSRGVEGAVSNDHGDFVFSAGVSQNPRSGHQSPDRGLRAGEPESLAGLSGAQQGGVRPTPASATRMG